eukprot:scaffold35708_cov129-Isochrysis_galbana.AAC.1
MSVLRCAPLSRTVAGFLGLLAPTPTGPPECPSFPPCLLAATIAGTRALPPLSPSLAVARCTRALPEGVVLSGGPKGDPQDLAMLARLEPIELSRKTDEKAPEPGCSRVARGERALENARRHRATALHCCRYQPKPRRSADRQVPSATYRTARICRTTAVDHTVDSRRSNRPTTQCCAAHAHSSSLLVLGAAAAGACWPCRLGRSMLKPEWPRLRTHCSLPRANNS